MTLTRWKMMAGVFGLSVGGLAAMADSNGPKPKPTAGDKPAPIVIPAPAPADVPQVPPAVAPAPLSIPTAAIELTPPSVACPAEMPCLPAPVATPTPTPTAKAEPVPVRDFEFVVPTTPVPPAIVATAAVEPAAMPEPIAVAPPSPPMPVTPTIAPMPVAVKSEPTPVPVPPPAVEPARQPEPMPMTSTVEKKLKVMLHMGDQRPRFEVKDDEEVYLKVVCDTVGVDAPTGKADTQSTVKAAGHCAFVTPGGDGVCDELTVVPGTGEVVVTGNVRFVYRWGRAETEVSGSKMTFRLGAAPEGMMTSAGLRDTVTPQPMPKVMPASYSVPR